MATIAEVLALAFQHHQAGKLAQAEQLYRQILQANPREPNALHLLGLIAHQTGRSEEAIACLTRAVAVNPQASDFHANLGAVYFARGRWPEAAASYANALRLRPDFPELHNHLGDALARQGKWQEAIAGYRQALALRPTYSEAHHNLGLALAALEQFDAALTSLEEALRLRPDYVEAHYNRGHVFHQLGLLAEAESSYRAALRQRPDLPEGHNNLGLALALQGRIDEALASYQEALRLRPDYADCYFNLGALLARQSKQDEAQACYEQALRIRPDYVEAMTGLATAFKDQGLQDEALVWYRKATAARPDDPVLASNLLVAMNYPESYDPDAYFAACVQWGERFGKGKVTQEIAVDRDPNRRLRIGYVSPDFRENVMGHYAKAIVEAHDRDQVEVYCYANVIYPDERTRHIQELADHWRSIVGLSDDRVADLIRQDRIDILIDHPSHLSGNRLGMFARKPAPIQVTHFGFCISTGLRAIDYRLVDAHCDPPGQTERFHTETLVRLPEVQWCYIPPPGLTVSPLPARQAGHVTFGSICHLSKVTGKMIGLWARLLHAVPTSRLVMMTGAGKAADERVLAAFRRQQVDPERITLVGRARRETYFQVFHRVDLCLDTYPFTGCNTTADSLWMGVPVVTLAGLSCTTRQGIAALFQAGLGEFVTQTPEDYLALATRLAGDLAYLEKLRSELRPRLEQALLTDVPRHTRNLEAAYCEMWLRYCR